MNLTDFQQKVNDALCGISLRFDEPMAKHTSFKIGGPAAAMAFPKTVEELSTILIESAKLDIKYTIIGAGTNILAPDAGMDRLVICLKDCLEGMEQLEGERIRVFAGVTMARAAVFAAGLGLGGLEFAHGIPGTVGGGVYMNAGAYGGEIAMVCESVDVMDAAGVVTTIPAEEMGFSYRHSRLEEEFGIVVSAVFRLSAHPEAQIREQMQTLMQKRKASQPLELPSAGSAFKRPVGGFAAALIDQAGLKGFQIGGAAVSEKHAGFVVNLGGATAADVRALLDAVADKVYDFAGIRLEPEIRIW